MRLGLALLAVLWLPACAPAVVSRGDAFDGGVVAAGGDRAAGALDFAANCATCHGPTGREGGIGPSLKHENQRLDFSALVSWIEDPQPPMPKLYPKFLTQRQVRDLAAYVGSL
ncbi:MAG TPA: cytochrome c [Candidatus Acidoferrales bacterium]|nr:cytochrome c [Candidatus Acidoferrales bacterium]